MKRLFIIFVIYMTWQAGGGDWVMGTLADFGIRLPSLHPVSLPVQPQGGDWQNQAKDLLLRVKAQASRLADGNRLRIRTIESR